MYKPKINQLLYNKFLNLLTLCGSCLYHIYACYEVGAHCLTGFHACIGNHATCKVDYANLSICIYCDVATVAFHCYGLSLYSFCTACHLG